MAEKEGFEPSIPLWGIHDFQSCALDQATRLLHVLFGLLSFQIVSLHIIIKICHKVKSHFERNTFFVDLSHPSRQASRFRTVWAWQRSCCAMAVSVSRSGDGAVSAAASSRSASLSSCV